MSLITQYNQPDETPLHSSGMAGDSGAPKPQSFTEREKIERSRRHIKSYRFSMHGSGIRPPGSMRKPQPRQEENADASSSTLARRQAFQTRSQQTPETPPPKYNPYA